MQIFTQYSGSKMLIQHYTLDASIMATGSESRIRHRLEKEALTIRLSIRTLNISEAGVRHKGPTLLGTVILFSLFALVLAWESR